jgi:replicative DNA helicase
MQKDLETRFISSITSPQDFADSSLAGINSDSFIIHREVYEFVAKYVVRYDNVPTPAIIEGKHPDFKFVKGVKDSECKYLVNELLKSQAKRKAVSILNRGSDLVNEDVYGGMDFILENLAKIRRDSRYSISYSDASAEERIEKFKKRRETIAEGGTIGIKTGFSFFDKYLLGWQPGNLISIIGRTGKGKSFLSLYLACFAYSEGYRVLYFSPEMTNEEQEDRFDTIMGALMGYKFSNKGLMVGDVNEAKYAEYAKRMSKRKDWGMIDSDYDRPLTISAIRSHIDQFGPQVVVIDGFLLLSIGKKDWQNMLEAAMELKSLAQSKKIVMLVNAQATKASKEKDMPEDTDIYGGEALAQASNVLIMMGEDPDEPKVRYVSVAKKRAGEGFNKKVKISFDLDIGRIGV